MCFHFEPESGTPLASIRKRLFSIWETWILVVLYQQGSLSFERHHGLVGALAIGLVHAFLIPFLVLVGRLVSCFDISTFFLLALSSSILVASGLAVRFLSSPPFLSLFLVLSRSLLYCLISTGFRPVSRFVVLNQRPASSACIATTTINSR